MTGYTISRVKEKNIQYENQITKDNFFDLYFAHVNPEEFFFLQVGANDGKTNDPIYPYVTRYGLKGVAVEVQPEVFLSLEQTYHDYPKVTCVNVAIARQTGSLPFFTVKDSAKTKENYSRMTGIASFNRDVIRHTIKNKLPKGVNVDDYIQESAVQTLTLNDLVREYGVTRIDMVQLDCEGYDYEIIKMIDFERFSPSIINFESNHLSDHDREECQAMLERLGYRWFRHGIDTCAYRI